MHTVLVRLNGIFFFALTVLLCLAVLCAFSSHFHKEEPIIHKLQLNKITSLRKYGGVDKALFNFDINADLRPAFHWNLKQIFVFVLAEYETPSNPLNQVIIWDKIITSKEDAHIKKNQVSLKYALFDHGSELRNRNITLKLVWDHMPLTGNLYVQDKTMSTFTLPPKYSS